MRSAFYGLEIARKGLRAAQVNLELSAHNIANANTEGFTRQQAIQKAIAPSMSIGLFETTTAVRIGGGVDIQEIRQIRDGFLDIQYRRENKSLGEWEVKKNTLSYIESVFNEPSDSGINTAINEFFNSLQALSMNPEDATTRAAVQQRALALTETIRDVYIKLEGLQSELNQNIIFKVNDINSYATRIAALNDQIFNFEVTGRKANDLRDERNLLLDKLSKLVDVTVFEDSLGRLRVDMGGGRMLVSHTDAFRLDVMRRSDSLTHPQYPKNNHVDIGGLVDVIWQRSGEVVNIGGGELKGLIDMRDGIGGMGPLPGDALFPGVPTELSGTGAVRNLASAPNNNNSYGVPYYMRMWNLFADTLMITFNAVHRRGYNLAGHTNINLFSDGQTNQPHIVIPFPLPPPPPPHTPITLPVQLAHQQPIARFITISDLVRDDWNNIATIYDVQAIHPTLERGNNKNVLRMLDLRHNTFIEEIPNIENFTKGLISTLGVASRQAAHMTHNQETLAEEMSRRRESISSVSIDEEMSAMVRFQHAYNASARMLTAIDEMLDVLVNRVGIVGR
jgi:flagellar hook-associated protein 1 FlgK